MSKNLFNSAKKFVTTHPTLSALAIPVFIIGRNIHKKSTIVAYLIGSVIAGAASGIIDGKLEEKRN